MTTKEKYYKKIDNQVHCNLCPHLCTINDGKRGICNVRKNVEGVLISENYGKVVALNLDPIEKKPLYHFYPGKNILSVGSFGCNMKCNCCQNWQISQASLEDFIRTKVYSPKEIADKALVYSDNLGVAYTYNEPTIYYEFMLDTAILVHRNDQKNVMVSNGFISPEPLQELLPFMDAFNIDIKAFNDSFYKRQAKARLEPVKETCKIIRKGNKHLEITTLIIPGLNDDEIEFCNLIDWIVDNLGEDTVLHLSRYYPTYKLSIQATTANEIENLYNIAIQKLNYIYVGNIQIKDYQNTKCPDCNNIIINRSGYYTSLPGLEKNGKCSFCGKQILEF